MSAVRVHARITGRVQGVWYRGSTCDEAERLGVVGWVRNLADGSVELEAEGPQAAVDALIAWCRRGPPGARVAGVEVEPRPASGGERGFRVR
jgi:acylphosphatase